MNGDRHSRLLALREELARIPVAPYPDRTWASIEAWIAKATPIIRSRCPDCLEDFRNASAEPGGPGLIMMNSDFTISEQESRRLWKASNEGTVQVRQRILSFLDGLLTLAPQSREETSVDKAVSICRRFPILARQLRRRGRGRPPVTVEDEYDLQYLLLALLRFHFEDVRTEEWTPSYAGGSSRMDFLAKSERIVVEAKKTRETLRDRELAKELIVDIARYAEHPDCDVLVCFVYDPDGWIQNPSGLERDLVRATDKIEVVVTVSN